MPLPVRRAKAACRTSVASIPKKGGERRSKRRTLGTPQGKPQPALLLGDGPTSGWASAAMKGHSVGIRAFGHTTFMLLTIGLCFVVAPAVGAVNSGKKHR